MTEAIIKRAFGACILAAILVVVVPLLFDGSGDVLQREAPSIVSVDEEVLRKLEEVENTQAKKRDELLKVQQVEEKKVEERKKDKQGRVVTERQLEIPLQQKKPDSDITVEIVDENSQDKKEVVVNKVTDATDIPEPQPIAKQLEEKQQQVSRQQEQKVDVTAEQQPSVPQQKPEVQEETKQAKKQSDNKQKTVKAAKSEPVTEQPEEPKQGPDKLGSFIRAQQGDWVVQMGLFSVEQNAKAFNNKVSKLKAFNKSFIRMVTIKRRKLHGVFSGPYINKQQAEKAKNSLQKQTGVKGYLRTYGQL